MRFDGTEVGIAPRGFMERMTEFQRKVYEAMRQCLHGDAHFGIAVGYDPIDTTPLIRATW